MSDSCNLPLVQVKEDASLEKFKQICTISLCQSGSVALYKDLVSGDLVVMKLHYKFSTNSRQAAEKVVSIPKRIMKISNMFIIPIRGIYQSSKIVYTEMDYMAGGDLYHYMKDNGPLSDTQAKFVTIQVISALACLHSNDIVYQNLHPENVLIDHKGNIRLAGFSNSIHLEPGKLNYDISGFCDYLSPEILLNAGHDARQDWWMLGCFVYEMLEGYPPYTGHTINIILQKVLVGQYEFKNSSPMAQTLIRGLLERNPEKRLGSDLNVLMKHKWFDDLPWIEVQQGSLESPICRPEETKPGTYYPHFRDDVVIDNPSSHRIDFFM